MAQLKIFDTLEGTLRDFEPLDEKEIKFYQCGPTVYWVQHIGNLRAMTLADFMRRSMQYLGYRIKFVRNYTDVGHLTGDNLGDADSGEDRMEKGAKREGLTPDELAQKYIDIFEADTASLNILPPDVTPRATEYIEEMIAMVKILLDNGYAYSTPQAIYFDVSKKKDYTKLSGQKLELNRKGAGHGEVVDSGKKHVEDFALWFFRTGVHANALQSWESPFESPEVSTGRGFPGWHLECSAMSKAELGETIDLHMGGREHIPVHHTNEIAQSESVTGKQFVRYWLHNEWLTIDDKKISKSEGTSVLLSDIIDKGFSPLALRYFFMQAHYRSKQNFTWESLAAADSALTKLQEIVSDWQQTSVGALGNVLEIYRARFVEAISEDFNLPQALAVVWLLAKSEANEADKLATLRDFDEVLGLDLFGNDTQLDPKFVTEVELLIKDRELARAKKDWQKSDEIRDILLERFNVTIKDTADGTKWSVR